MKSANWISAIGRSPTIDAPIADAIMFPSASGVSSTRSSPNLSYSPAVALKTPPDRPISSPITNTRSSRSISCAIASVMASIIVILRAMFSRSPFILAPRPAYSCLFLCPNMIRELRGIRIRALLGELDGFIDFLRSFFCDFVFRFVGEELLVAENFLEQHQRVSLLPRFHFFLHAVLGRIDFRVAIPAVRLAFEERRAITRARPRNRFRRGVVHGHYVIAIEHHTRKTVRLGAIRQILQRCLQPQRHRFSPQIILANVNNWQPVNAGKI